MNALKPIPYYQRILPLDLPATARFIFSQAGTMNNRVTRDSFFKTFCGYNSEIMADDVVVVGDVPSSRYVLVGAVTAFRSLTHLSVVFRGRRMCEVKVWQPEIPADGEPEELAILEGPDWRALLIEYGERVSAAMKALRPPADEKNTTGYCSWYYYYKDVTEKDFLENVDILGRMQDSPFKARYVQIDDGYQVFQGDWNDQHANWPTPLRDVAARIRGYGMEAGIWTMPFHASTASKVFRDHPEWFVKGADGHPLVAKGWSPPPDHMWATLDTTQDAVLEHLKKIFRTFREWGYTYFKMDGLGFALLDGIRADPNATSVSAFRKGLQAIREAVPDSFLLACSQHFLPCVGIVDGARFSDDTHASTEPIFRAFLQTSNRFWMFDRFYRADPDCLIVRTDRGTQTEGESRISALSGIITGFALTSDRLDLLPPERLALLGRAAATRMRNVRPSGATHSEWSCCWPSCYIGTIDGKPAAALVNFDDKPVTRKLAEVEGFDAAKPHREILHPLGSVGAEIVVAPHDAVLLVEG